MNGVEAGIAVVAPRGAASLVGIGDRGALSEEVAS